MTVQQNATPDCQVEIYPFEGGQYSIRGGQILAVSTQKGIREDSGDFSITLAPGGPGGVNSTTSWAEIITPMSFVMVGIRRGSAMAIVMLGVVVRSSESQTWSSNGQVQRQITITGQDFGYFFAQFGWYSLWYLGAIGATADPTNPASGVANLAGGLLQGSPAAVGKSWYDNVMAGTKGILNDTFVPYHNGRVLFPNAMATLFQEWKSFIIPFADYFISAEGPWIEKFRLIFPAPWYEFFIDTAPPGTYAGADGGYGFSMSAFGTGVTASPVLVARINPVPALVASSSASIANYDDIDTTLWNALPVNDLGGIGFFRSQIMFSSEGVRNFYTLNPTWFRALFGIDNSNMSNFPVFYSSAGDVGSIHRYGWKPADGTLNWLSDPTGDQARTASNTGSSNVAGDMLADLTAKLASWWEPQGIMATAMVAMPLRPDIKIGTRFRYQPFKSEGDYEFYVENVAHDFVFGGDSRTTLTLSRGLPVGIYQDKATLLAVHTGRAQRINGKVMRGEVSGLGPGLQAINVNALKQFMTELTTHYQSPQQ